MIATASPRDYRPDYRPDYRLDYLEVLTVRNYRLKIHALPNDRIDEITAILHQYDDYLASIAAGDRHVRRAESRLQMIEAAAQECGCRDDLIAVCCRKSTPPRSPEFNRARRGFYLLLSQMLD